MPTATRTFRVFVSSTFEDLKEERNALQREVFPKLAKLCEEHGARFQAIDLRWGVRDEAGLDQKTMEICLAEIERCKKTNLKPNFIVLLGDRYGWRPLPAGIEAGEFERVGNAIGDDEKRALIDNWYQRDDNAVPPEFLLKPRTGEFTDAHRWGDIERVLHGVLREAARNAGVDPDGLIKYEASATHQEILKGLGRDSEDREHVFAFLRNAQQNQDPDLASLKKTLKQQLGENVFSFDAGDYDELCERVMESLERVILKEIARFESRSALDLEVDAQNTFAGDRSRHFVGRAAVMSAIDDYLKSDDRRPMVIYGASGSGKSTIMAKASGAERAVRRFIGATPESSNGLTLLRSLCQEIARRYGQSEDVPAIFNELAVTFADRIKLATPERPILLFLDALDQLGPQDPAAAANWLPIQLPPHCKIIVSTIQVPSALQRAGLLSVERFSTKEADRVLALWFEEVQRTLQKKQREKLLARFRRSPLPLYLKLAFEEARCWKSFSPIGQCVLGEGLTEIIDQFFTRLSEESNHGPVVVSRALGYLAAARYGLTENEVLAVLSADEEVWMDFRNRAKHDPPERRLPVTIWSRLYMDLEPYLTERVAPGGTVISFYHRRLVEQVPVSSIHHSALVSHFAGQTLWLGTQRPNQRKVTELVRQQVRAALLDDAVGTLTDIAYLEAKCAAELVFDLQEDYREAMMALPEAQSELREEERRAAELARWTKALVEYARLWNARRDRRSRISFVLRPIRRQEPRMPDMIRSVNPWTDERIKEECERIMDKPMRVDLINSFARFVEQEVYALSEFANRHGFLVQHAFNGAPQGPVHTAALSNIGGIRVPMLLRCWPEGVVYNPRPALLRILEGHTSSVNGVALSSDGRRVVSSDDRTIKVWDLESGRELRTLKGHSDLIECVAVSADGRRAVSASRDRTLKVWDLDTGCELRTLEGHGDVVEYVAISPDGRRAVSASCDHSLILWDVDTGLRLSQLAIHQDSVNCVAMTPNGCRGISGSSDRSLSVWDLDSGKWLRRLTGHGDKIYGVAMSADGRRAVSACRDQMLKVWDVETGRELRELKGHTSYVDGVAVSPDGRRAVSASGDKMLNFWDLETGGLLRTFAGHSDCVNAVAMSADGCIAVSASSDHTLKVWDLETGSSLPMGGGHLGAVRCVAVSPNGLFAISASMDHTLKVWEVKTGRELRSLRGHKWYVDGVAVSPSGQVVISACRDNSLKLWDLNTGVELRTLALYDGTAQVAVSPDGRFALRSGFSLVLWDLETGTPVHMLRGGERPDWVNSIAVSRDGVHAVSSCDQSSHLTLWDLKMGLQLRRLEGHSRPVSSVAVHMDGHRVISASYDGTLKVWDFETGREIRTLKGHSGAVNSVALHAEGRYVVSASSDHTLRVWDLESYDSLAVVRLTAPLNSVAWASSANRIVAGSSTGDVFFFDVYGIHP